MQSPVPAFSHSLKSLAKILTIAEAHCEEHKIDPSVLLHARLYPTMLDLTRNVLIACDTAKGMAARLTETENPSLPDDEKTFADLHARIEKTLAFMASVPGAAFERAEGREVVLQAGPDEFKFDGTGYLWTFATPNFYFHISTVYGILRHNGVALGKRNYLGA